MIESEALTAAPSLTLDAAAVVHGLTTLEEHTQIILTALPNYEDEQLLEVLKSARQAGAACWQIECACQYEILNRLESRQGKKDGMPGKQKEIDRLGAALGVTRKTLTRNAAIGQLLTQLRDSPVPKSWIDKNLPEKQFFVEAISAPKPLQALVQFAEAKEENPFYHSGDARRWVVAQKSPAISAQMPSLIDEPGMQAAWSQYLNATRILREASHGRLNGLLTAQEAELREELSAPPCLVMERIEELLRQGYDEIDLMAERGGWERDWVIRWFRKLEEDRCLNSYEKERITEGARGAARTGYTPTPTFYRELDKLMGRVPLDASVKMGRSTWGEVA